MTDKPDQNQNGPITSKMHDLLGCMCVVTFKLEGDRRGVIDQIEALTILQDFPDSFEESQFRVHLTSGDIVVVPGSAITEIESTVAARRSTSIKKKAATKGGVPEQRHWPEHAGRSRESRRQAGKLGLEGQKVRRKLQGQAKKGRRGSSGR